MTEPQRPPATLPFSFADLAWRAKAALPCADPRRATFDFDRQTLHVDGLAARSFRVIELPLLRGGPDEDVLVCAEAYANAFQVVEPFWLTLEFTDTGDRPAPGTAVDLAILARMDVLAAEAFLAVEDAVLPVVHFTVDGDGLRLTVHREGRVLSAPLPERDSAIEAALQSSVCGRASFAFMIPNARSGHGRADLVRRAQIVRSRFEPSDSTTSPTPDSGTAVAFAPDPKWSPLPRPVQLTWTAPDRM